MKGVIPMKKRVKKFISLTLVLCMFLTLLPLGTASAITLSAGAVHMVSAGNNHTLMIRNDGSLWAWGGNWAGTVGDGTNIDRHTPVMIMSDVAA